jgi:hypothetical protein
MVRAALGGESSELPEIAANFAATAANVNMLFYPGLGRRVGAMRELLAEVGRSGALRRGARRSGALPEARSNARKGETELPAELAAFEGAVDPALLEIAALRAERLGVGGDEVLRCAGILSPREIEAGIAAHLDLRIDPLDDEFAPRSLAAACAGVLRRKGKDGRSIVTVATRGTGVRWLAERLAEYPDARSHLRIAAPERLAEYVRSMAARELGQEAIYCLHAMRPDHSAIGYGRSQLQSFTLVFAASVIGAGVFAPGAMFIAIEYFLAFSFISWTLLRLAACLFPKPAKPAFEISDRDLPIYTIIVPLYREAPVVAKLVRALREIDYPALGSKCTKAVLASALVDRQCPAHVRPQHR